MYAITILSSHIASYVGACGWWRIQVMAKPPIPFATNCVPSFTHATGLPYHQSFIVKISAVIKDKELMDRGPMRAANDQ